jgi:hypothetical protein
MGRRTEIGKWRRLDDAAISSRTILPATDESRSQVALGLSGRFGECARVRFLRLDVLTATDYFAGMRIINASLPSRRIQIDL